MDDYINFLSYDIKFNEDDLINQVNISLTIYRLLQIWIPETTGKCMLNTEYYNRKRYNIKTINAVEIALGVELITTQ